MQRFLGKANVFKAFLLLSAFFVFSQIFWGHSRDILSQIPLRFLCAHATFLGECKIKYNSMFYHFAMFFFHSSRDFFSQILPPRAFANKSFEFFLSECKDSWGTQRFSERMQSFSKEIHFFAREWKKKALIFFIIAKDNSVLFFMNAFLGECKGFARNTVSRRNTKRWELNNTEFHCMDKLCFFMFIQLWNMRNWQNDHFWVNDLFKSKSFCPWLGSMITVQYLL